MMKNANTSVTLKNQNFKSGFEPVALYIERSSCTNGGNASNFGSYVPLPEIMNEFIDQFYGLEGFEFPGGGHPYDDYFANYGDMRLNGFDLFSYRTEGNASQRVLRHDGLLDANHNIDISKRPNDVLPITYCNLAARKLKPVVKRNELLVNENKGFDSKPIIINVSPQPANDFFDVEINGMNNIAPNQIEIYDLLSRNITNSFLVKSLEVNKVRINCKDYYAGNYILKVKNSGINVPISLIR